VSASASIRGIGVDVDVDGRNVDDHVDGARAQGLT
jgi:hypothetical protein